MDSVQHEYKLLCPKPKGGMFFVVIAIVLFYNWPGSVVLKVVWHLCKHSRFLLKGKFPQTTMWIGWVESNFTNPTVKVWADLDNPFARSDYAKLCMSPSLDGTLPEYVTSQEDNSTLTLYIDFHNFLFFLDINSPFDQVHS